MKLVHILTGGTAVITIGFFAVKIYHNRPRRFFDAATKREIYSHTAFSEVTKGMPHTEIYTAKGAIRTPILQKLNLRLDDYADDYETHYEALARELSEKGIVDDNEMIKAKDLITAGELFCALLKNERKKLAQRQRG